MAHDIAMNYRYVGPAYREDGITLLPSERWFEMSGGPKGRSFLEFANNVGRSVGRTHAHKEVNMIFNASHGFGHAAQTTYGPSKIFMQARSPGILYEGTAFFGAKNNMVVETVER